MADTNTNSHTLGNEFTAYFNLPCIIIGVIGVASNVLLLVAFIKDPLKCFRNSGTYLVMNVSISDCVVGLFSSLSHITRKVSVSYPIIYFIVFWVVLVSFVSITSISIDRFLMISYPIKHRILIKGKVMISWIAAIWMVSCVIPLFQTLSDFPSISIKRALYIFCVIVIALSAVMYLSTYYKLKKHSRNIALQNAIGNRAQEIRILKEKRFLKTIIVIACLAFACTLPFLVRYLIYSYLDHLQAKAISFKIYITIMYINFAVNPFIYILRLPNYRKTFYLIYWRRRTASS